MNKKQKNRKIVAQSKRNRLINRRYTSTIKTLSKLFSLKIKTLKLNNVGGEELSTLKLEILSLVKNLYSIIDKAVKKKVLHRNNAARKKSKISKLLVKFS